ncbi:MAG: CRTAC1 family protein [Planctomycetota bacterium]
MRGRSPFRSLPLAFAVLFAVGGWCPGVEAQGLIAAKSRDAWFRDASKSLGVEFDHDDSKSNYTIGSGSAWFDMDADGDEDLFVQNSTGPHALYRKDGLTFTDVIEGSGITNLSGNESMGVAVADYDADGLQDVYLCNADRNTFFVNTGGGVFVEDAIALGLAAGHAWSVGASWADFDVDGDLDLYVGNYVVQFNFPYHYGAPNALLENRGPGASPWFEDVGPALGVDNSGVFGPSVPGFSYVSPEGETTAGCTLATGTLDWDEDGDPDLQVGNDFGLWVLPNALYRNDLSGGVMSFTDVSAATGFDTRPHYNMGIYPADFDHDGDWDFYNSNLGDNLLLRNDGGVFVDGTYDAGPISGKIIRGFEILKLSSWGIIWEDFDNDTWEDLVVVNGFIPAASFIVNEKRSPNHFWQNQGDSTFLQVPAFFNGVADEGAGRSVTKADVNGDGLLDFYLQNNGSVYVTHTKDRSRLFMNTGMQSTPGHWIEMDLVGRIGHPDALGVRVDLHLPGTVLKRQRLGDPVFLGSPSRMVHFGLGAAASIDRIELHWPSGVQQTLRDVASDQRVELLEPAVTGEGVQPADYQGEVLTLAVSVQNHDEVDQPVAVLFEVRDAADGSLFFQSAGNATVPAGSTATVSAAQAIPTAVYAAYQGLSVEIHADVAATGSLDQDMQVQALP